MQRDSKRGLWNFLNRPLFGTKVIPPNARVDPSLFPEEEFPVYCAKCDYSLRGLPDSRCPECGEPFDRGRLLVLQYVEGRAPHLKRLGNILGCLAAVGLLLYFGLTYGARYLLQFNLKSSLSNANPATISAVIDRYKFILRWIQLVYLLMLVSILIGCSWMIQRRYTNKRRQIIAQIHG